MATTDKYPQAATTTGAAAQANPYIKYGESALNGIDKQAIMAAMFRNNVPEEQISHWLSTGDLPTGFVNTIVNTPKNYALGTGPAIRNIDYYGISDRTKPTWEKIAELYNSGDTKGAFDLVGNLIMGGAYSGWYDDDGKYWGFVQGHAGGADRSYQPVMAGRIISSGLENEDTNIWLTPDGKAMYMGANGVLTDRGDTWSAQTPRTDIDLNEYNRQLMTKRADTGETQHTGPAVYTGVPNANGGMDYTNTTYPGWLNNDGGATPYQQALSQYPQGGSGSGGQQYPSGGQTPMRYAAGYPEAYDPAADPVYIRFLEQYGDAKSPEWTGGDFDSAGDPMYVRFLEQYENAQAPEYGGSPYDALRDGQLRRYGEQWGGSPYQQQRDEALKKAQETEWSYDPNTDPVWQAYQKQYRREGRRATEDTLGRLAGMTGGMPSSYAASAAAQAGNYYASQLSDKLPQLYQDAYNRYLDEYKKQLGISDYYAAYDDKEYERWRDRQGDALTLADAYGKLGSEDYDRYRDARKDWLDERDWRHGLAQNDIALRKGDYDDQYKRYLDEADRYGADRKFAYGLALDSQKAGRQQAEDRYTRYLDALERSDAEAELAYRRQRDAVEDARHDAEWAQKLREYADAQNWKAEEWRQYLAEYGDKLSQAERSWAYQQYRDEISDSRYADETGYSRERQERLDTQNAEEAEYARLLNEAKLAASYGDYSGLEALGITPNAENLRALAIAEAGRTTPVGSGVSRSGGSGGRSGSGEDEEEAVESYSTSTVNAAYRAYLGGDRSDLTMRILRSAGLVEADGIPDEGDPESRYALMDRVLADMQAKGRPWNQLLVELDAELRDERITPEEYEALRQKYVSRGLEDGVANLEGTVHRDGSPMSAGFAGVWRNVRDLADRGKKEEALAAMRRAWEAGNIHEYEIDIMMDQLGW